MLKQYNQKLVSLKLKTKVKLKRYVSKGSFNTVFKGVYLNINKQRTQVAVKFFNPAINSDGVFEGAVLQKIQHPHLVGVLCMNLTPTFGVIVSPWCTVPLTAFDVPRLRVLVDQLWDGLRCLHSHSLAHMDVKPDNVLVDLSGDSVIYKLTDFNLMHFLATQLTCWVGTEGFIAPEVLAASPENPYLVSRTADFYSLGILAKEIYPLSNHRPPWIDRLLSPTPSQRTLIPTD
ncbi:protein ORF70 [Lake sturgeon herpesvirus]|nr:protein ORF70 [Lake sturgeon herpesvirus]